MPDEPTEIEQHFAEVHDTHYNGTEAVCARPTRNNSPCTKAAGWGTVHFGYGACKLHGGEEPTALDVKPIEPFKYSLQVTNERLKAILQEEEHNSDLDNLDGEIILVRGMIRLLSESFGLKLDITTIKDLSEAATSPSMTEAYLSMSDQTRDAMRLINNLAALIKKKYEILSMADAVIPRHVVDSYINQIKVTLMNTMKNTCPSCHAETGQRDAVMIGLSLIGSI